jgi:copper(I)-binding protein
MRSSVALTLWAVVASSAWAHQVQVGAITLHHPYAVLEEDPAGAQVSVYFRQVKNDGDQADRLVAASSAAAQRVELQRGAASGGRNTLRRVDAFELGAHSQVPMRQTGEQRLVLVGLQRPLRAGDFVELTLGFEHAGSRTFKVELQSPSAAAKGHVH